MSRSCFMIDCEEKPFFSCSCSDSKYICQSHLISHILSVGNHMPSKLYTQVNDNQRTQIINYLASSQALNQKSISNLKTFTNQLINLINSESQKTLKKLLKTQEKLKEKLKFFICNSLIKTNLVEQSNFQAIRLVHDQELTKVEKSIKYVFDLDSWSPLSKQDDFAIIFLPTLGRNIDLIDLKSLKRQIIDLQMNDLLHYCSCCKLDQSRYFVYGGSSPMLSSARIIDLKTKTSELLPSSSELCNAGTCLYRNQVYVFGGSASSYPQAACSRFLLETRTWNPIQALPEANYATSASLLNNRILVTGFQSGKVFAFVPHQNCFTVSKINLKPNTWKFLIDNFLVSFGSYLYEVDENEDLVNRQSLTENGGYLNSSAYFKRGRFLYFVVTGPRLFRIDTSSKIIESVDFT